ncbi:RagB/SusD family nutrient uptake outer membrane protein [Algoriphagus sp. CAU 1675]|uniref:RagB/SusD family nutrient uptake outer membrane protein n=1 Tax=Algoriphagus sp. CAU 1675 TaxID=3032597 RepID=UPI0023DC971E|nr:RagB/SusD family nutrient uptake outer membrane protein [Algoriphagus sp. CAU 1675]MDF2159018.1 RagB/SusD family nutrient uptake outer membrane protein [Algoriphagus sp. CAU 1675]
MKKILYILCFIGLASCAEDYLERGSLTQLAEGNFWQNEKDAQLGLNGVYEVLQDRVLYSGGLNEVAGLPSHDSFADNTFNNYKFEGPGNFVEGRADPSYGYFLNFWTSLYKGIARANVAIENISRIPDSHIDPESRAALVAQARFLRALFYFNLAVYFEDVPLIQNSQTLEEAYVSKNTYEEVKSFIISELRMAADDLPDSYPASQFGYATRGAALSLLARFELYNKNYGEVLRLTSEIMGLGYELHPDYGQLFTEAGEQSKEIVFSVRFIQDQSNNGETFSATYLGIPKVNIQPMPNMVNAYLCIDGLPITESPLYNAAKKNENRDPRLTSSVYFEGDIFLKYLNRPFRGNTATKFGLKKYVRDDQSPDGIGPASPGGQDFYLIRYAEVLLMRAEALVESGQFSEVYTLLDQLRERAGMPTVTEVNGTGLSQEELLDMVKLERRVELAFEGLRFFDVKRWGEVEAAYARAKADPVGPYNPVYRGRQSEVFAIPQSEIDANSNLIQNPVWN